MERAMSAAAGEANIHTAAAERHLWLGLWLGGLDEVVSSARSSIAKAKKIKMTE